MRLVWLLGCIAALAAGLLSIRVYGVRQQGPFPVTINAKAPEMVGGPWINTADDKPITLASRKGKVTVVEFWTFG